MSKKRKRRSKETGERYHISAAAIKRSTGISLAYAKAVANDIYRVGNDNYWEVVVVTLDIRNSSIALVNLEDFEEYSNVITDYVCYVVKTCQSKGYPCKVKIRNDDGEVIEEYGWFDKFTGDGVVIFWRLPNEPEPDEQYDDLPKKCRYHRKVARYNERWNEAIRAAIEFSIKVTTQFLNNALPDIRKTCGLLPTDFGMSVGIDAGECLLTELKASENFRERSDRYGVEYSKSFQVSPNVTVIGRPIIGATRMVSKAKHYEIIVNSYPGGKLKAALDDPKDKLRQGVEFSLERTRISTKEYKRGVEAYRIVSPQLEQTKKADTFCAVTKETSVEEGERVGKGLDARPEREDDG